MEATEALIGFMGGKGNILNVLELVEDPNTILRKEGVEAAVAKYPAVQIVQEIARMESIETSTAKIQDAISARIEEIDGVICTGYTPTVAAATILSEWNQTPGQQAHPLRRHRHGLGGARRDPPRGHRRDRLAKSLRPRLHHVCYPELSTRWLAGQS